MVTRLMKHDLCEMVLEWYAEHRKGKRTEKITTGLTIRI